MTLFFHQIIAFCLKDILICFQKADVSARRCVLLTFLAAHLVDLDEVGAQLLGTAGVVGWQLVAKQHFRHLQVSNKSSA